MNTVVALSTIKAPSIAYFGLSPMLILLGAACVGILVEAFAPRHARQTLQVVLALGALVASLVMVVLVAGMQATTAAAAIAVDGPALFLEGSIAVLGIASVFLIAERSLDSTSAFVASAAITAGSPADQRLSTSPYSQTEVFPLTLFALGGMMLFASANNLLLMFVALEILSLPLYLMAGLSRRRRLLSQESAVKYFLLGAFASAFFLYGVALLYGYADSVQLRGIFDAAAAGRNNDLLLYLGLAMLIIGLMFKAGVAPFHSWSPDVYQGAPTGVTALMAACTKVAAFGAILRVLYVAFANTRWDWRPVIWAIAIITMVVGSVLALTQTDIKRLLAYSSVANAGFILTGTVAMTRNGVSSTMFYLLTYGFTTIGAFALVTLVRNADGEAWHLSQWAGLAKRSPLFAATFTFFMLAFAGIPLTSGFTSKFAVFSAAIGGGATPLVIVGVIASAVIAFPYLRVVVLMYLSDPAPDGPRVSVPGTFTTATLALGVLVTLVLGIAPQLLLDLAHNASVFVG